MKKRTLRTENREGELPEAVTTACESAQRGAIRGLLDSVMSNQRTWGLERISICKKIDKNL